MYPDFCMDLSNFVFTYAFSQSYPKSISYNWLNICHRVCFRFEKAIGMDIKICIVVAFLVAFLKILPYIYWSKSKMRFQDTVIFASIPHFVYSWRLEPTDPQPVGTKLDISLREKEKLIGYDLDNRLDPLGKNITVNKLVERYISTKTGAKNNTKNNYGFVKNLLKKQAFGNLKISKIKTSDAKLFLIKLQQEDKKGYSTIKTVRGVLRPAFQMAVDDDVLNKNPFGFELAGVVVNDSVTREAVTKDQMRKFLKFVHDDVVYCKYYEVVYILFHTGMRISEFCGLTLSDIDLEKKIINIDHQLQRSSKMEYIIESTKTNAGTRKLPMTDDVAQCFRAIIEDREPPEHERIIDGYGGFLFTDIKGYPEVAMHWEHRFKHMLNRYNEIYRVQMPKITPHVCRHTYCSNMAKARMNPKTL